jgi:DNA-binding NarL/FixJ family response regulator
VTIRVLVVDDQPVVRTGFHTILDVQPDIDVVGEAEDGQEAVSLAQSLRPDVVLMDVRMPRMDGIEATRQIAAGREGADDGRPHVLILTTFDLDDYVYAALKAGASGFLLKDASRDDLVRAVRVVAAGEALLAPAVTRRLIAEFIDRPNRTRPDDSRLDTLTPREREVLLHMARGRSNAEIAAELILGEATIKSHVAHVLMKLDLRDRVQAVILAYELGLVTPGEV